MTLVWLIYGIVDECKPIWKQQLLGEAGNGYVIALMPCLLIDCIIGSIINHFM